MPIEVITVMGFLLLALLIILIYIFHDSNDETIEETIKETKVNHATNEESKQLICKNCGNTNFQFVESYAKYAIPISVRIIVFFALSITVIIGCITKFFIAIIAFITFVIFFVIIKITDIVKQQQTHTKAICQQCGHIEYLD